MDILSAGHSLCDMGYQYFVSRRKAKYERTKNAKYAYSSSLLRYRQELKDSLGKWMHDWISEQASYACNAIYPYKSSSLGAFLWDLIPDRVRTDGAYYSAMHASPLDECAPGTNRQDELPDYFCMPLPMCPVEMRWRIQHAPKSAILPKGLVPSEPYSKIVKEVEEAEKLEKVVP